MLRFASQHLREALATGTTAAHRTDRQAGGFERLQQRLVFADLKLSARSCQFDDERPTATGTEAFLMDVGCRPTQTVGRSFHILHEADRAADVKVRSKRLALQDVFDP